MAIIDYSPGEIPRRGKIAGTVFQEGRYAPVVKGKHSSQGQRLAPNLRAQEALSHSSTLFDTLSAPQKANWTAAIPDFPTVDRYGNPVYSDARHLFMRTVARRPIDLQTALSGPRPAYTGAALTPGSVSYTSGVLTYTPAAVPAGEQLSYSLFMSKPQSLGISKTPAYMRQVYFILDTGSVAPIDITSDYVALFGEIPEDGNVFFCEEVYNATTPQLLSKYCSQVTVPRAFIFTVTVTAGQSFQLPTISAGTYNALIDWGDGNSNTLTVWNASGRSHTYTSTGIYTITINGTFHGWRVNFYGDRLKITEVIQWGILRPLSLNLFMYGCTNLTISANDILDCTGVNSCYWAFRECQALTTIPSINSWDLSASITFQAMFYNAHLFSQNLSFDTGLGTDFSLMFYNARVFNGTLLFDMSSAENCNSMFRQAYLFNQSLTWHTPNLQRTNQMFYDAWALDSPILFSDMSNVIDCRYMFYIAKVFNQPLDFVLTSSASLFWFLRAAVLYDQSLGDIDISTITDFNNFLTSVHLSTANYDDTLIKWAAQAPQSGVSINFNGATYTLGGAAEAARITLTTTYNWTITDGGGV